MPKSWDMFSDESSSTQDDSQCDDSSKVNSKNPRKETITKLFGSLDSSFDTEIEDGGKQSQPEVNPGTDGDAPRQAQAQAPTTVEAENPTENDTPRPRSTPEDENADLPQRSQPEREAKTGLGLLAAFRRAKKRGSMECDIPRVPFQRIVREIAVSMKNGVRFQGQALDAIQEATEAYAISFFEDAGLCAAHAKRVTVMVPDVKLAKRLRRED